MNTTISTEKRKKIAKAVLPLVILPFAAILFSAMGGGQSSTPTGTANRPSELKTDLPGANLKSEGLDKMSYYAQAKTDSLKREEMMRNDPYYQAGVPQQGNTVGLSQSQSGIYGVAASGGYMGRQESMIYDRINSINASISQPYAGSQAQPFSSLPGAGNVSAADIDRLEQMMTAMQSKQGADSEVTEIGNLLKSIQEIQRPELVTERLRQSSVKNRGQVYTVNGRPKADIMSVLVKPKSDASSAGFYGLAESTELQEPNAIRAVVHETQTLTDGAVVKMRLSNDVFVNGSRIPEDSFIYGIASLRGERLEIAVDNIHHSGSLFPVKLSVYDLDGIPGIHIPGAISRDVAKQSGANAIQGVSLANLDPSLAAQAATAGIELTKGLIGKKVKLVKVTVKSGYRVILKDDNLKD